MMTRLVTEYLDQSVKIFPDKIAFSDENREVTFKKVQDEAHHIAMALIKRKLVKKPVAVFLDKNVECIVSFMGVAYSGNFYTPIDINMPEARIKKIMETLETEVIITDKSHKALAEKIYSESEILLLEEAMQNPIDTEVISKTAENIIDTDVLYVLFTSGSTGDPKGVIVPHRSVIAYTEWAGDAFSLNEEMVLANQTPFYFSMSVFDIYQTIRNGATMYILPKQLFSFPVRLLEYLEQKKINTIYWVPSVLCIVANFKALGRRAVDSLKKILFAGEVMPNKQLNMWRKAFPDAMFANLFGPTEVTDICAYYVVNRTFEDHETLPIGHSCRNADVLVLDNKGRTVAYGEVGELCVRGSFLAYGYYNNPQKTREVFVQNPINPCYPEIVYKTGDLVKYNEFGELVYISRKDFQIKHMGYRIELGEIEAAVSAVSGIDAACCQYDEKRSRIVLFYTGKVNYGEVEREIKKLLPEYMMPNEKIYLKEMPLNLNGKIDRVSLKKMI